MAALGGNPAGSSGIGEGGAPNSGAAGTAGAPESDARPRCEGTLSFSPLPLPEGGTSPCSVVAEDLNGDHIVDLAVGNCGNASVSVFLRNEDGSFMYPVNYRLTSTLRSLSVGDLNDDGKPDLAIGTGEANVVILFNQGAGKFSRGSYFPAGSFSYRIALSDVDRDQDLDLVISNLDSSPELVALINLGNGAFSDPVVYATGLDICTGVAASDLNGDGIPDLVVGGGSQVSVGLNTADGRGIGFTRYLAGSEVAEVALADFNRDGAIDIAVASRPIGSGVTVLLNQGHGTFAPDATYPTSANGIVATDLDADGNPDLVVPQAYGSDVRILLNRLPGRHFNEFITVPGEHSPDSVAATDLNGDGLPDLILTYVNDNRVTVLFTECDTPR